MIFSLGGGSSSGKLNYKIVSSTTEPTNPSENMIWVNASSEVTHGTLGSYINATTGVITKPSSNTCNTRYFPCVAGNQYRIQLDDAQTVLIASFDVLPANDVTGTILYGAGKTNGEATLDYTITSPEGASYLAIWYFDSSANSAVPNITITNLTVQANLSGQKVVKNYAFAETNPFIEYEDAPEGAVWFKTQETSLVSINILKDKNELYVYPTDCQQYICGGWVRSEAKIYQYGRWMDWVYYLYNKGNIYEGVTGGWVTEGKKWESSEGSTKLPTMTFEEESLHIYHTCTTEWNVGGLARLANPISLANYSTLCVEGSFVATRSTNRLFIWTSMGTYLPSNAAAYVNLSGLTNRSKIEIDISSLDEEYYIGFGCYNTTSGTYADIKVDRMYLK